MAVFGATNHISHFPPESAQTIRLHIPHIANACFQACFAFDTDTNPPELSDKMQLIWPNNIRFTSEGYLLGRRTDRVICVLSVVENWVSLFNFCLDLRSLIQQQTVQAIMNNDRLRAEDTSGASNMVMQVVGRAGKAVQAGKLDERDIQVVVRKGSLTNCT